MGIKFQRTPRTGILIESIKFRSSWVDPNSYGLVKAKEMVFEMGLGPCGRHVTELRYEVDEDLLKISQWSRHPCDLAPPTDDYYNACRKIDRHEDAERLYERERRLAGYCGLGRLVRPEETVTTGFWWWKRTYTIPAETLPEIPKPEGFLEATELAALKAHRSAIWQAHAKWQDAVEVKHFIYKMADVHGRIEVVK
uniref:Uncharacterized protein n=1 Tax=Pseudomonas phage Lepni01 TaxID=3138536 RepID=A0AAU6W3B9_9VIRU